MMSFKVYILLIFLISVSNVHAQSDTTQWQQTLEPGSRQNAIADRYAILIKAGDSRFTIKDYIKAKSYYEQALKLRPSDPYPKAKIADIEKIMVTSDQTTDQAESQIKHDVAMKEADILFESGKLTEARDNYILAATYNPQDQHAKHQIFLIDQTLAYDQRITKADSLFATKDFQKAKESYIYALVVKSNESHPINRIVEIEAILENQASINQNKSKFDSLITIADKQLELKEYHFARYYYNKALSINPEDLHSEAKIKEIDRIIRYNSFIEEADKFFAQKDYVKAREWYDRARLSKLEESYPVEKLIELEAIRQSEMEKQ